MQLTFLKKLGIDCFSSPGFHHVQARFPKEMVGMRSYWMGYLLNSHGQYTYSDSHCLHEVDATNQSTGYNPAGLIIARIGLGFFEAGFGPAIPLYFCAFPSITQVKLNITHYHSV